MIVKDKKEILNRSDKLSNKYLKIIEKETKKFILDDDPPSHIYFSVYCVAMAAAKISLGIERFAQIYNIPALTANEALNWMIEVSKEIIKENSKNIH